MTWHGPKSEKLIDGHNAEYWLKYTDCAQLRKITITNCLIFFKSFKFHCCSFCLI